MNKKELAKLLREKQRRSRIKGYQEDFTRFAEEQIQIVTKDVSKGFVPFKFNEAQRIITEKLEEQKNATGKVRAIILKARQQGMSPHAMAGAHRISDLITSINTYEPSANADGNSNAIATYFANIAGRDFLTSLFHDRWLLLHNPLIRFRGAYGPTAFEPSAPTWLNLTTQAVVNIRRS